MISNPCSSLGNAILNIPGANAVHSVRKRVTAEPFVPKWYDEDGKHASFMIELADAHGSNNAAITKDAALSLINTMNRINISKMLTEVINQWIADSSKESVEIAIPKQVYMCASPSNHEWLRTVLSSLGYDFSTLITDDETVYVRVTFMSEERKKERAKEEKEEMEKATPTPVFLPALKPPTADQKSANARRREELKRQEAHLVSELADGGAGKVFHCALVSDGFGNQVTAQTAWANGLRDDLVNVRRELEGLDSFETGLVPQWLIDRKRAQASKPSGHDGPMSYFGNFPSMTSRDSPSNSERPKKWFGTSES